MATGKKKVERAEMRPTLLQMRFIALLERPISSESVIYLLPKNVIS